MNTPAATSPLPPPEAGGGASPDWVETYFRALAESRQKALAALAAGQKLPAVVRQRFTDPAFARREAEILATLADLLESEAIRRTTSTVPCKKVGSDALLLRLLEIFHPHWSLGGKKALARLAPAHCTPNRPIRARRQFDFDTAEQRRAFRQWEREEAIALAIRLFHAEFDDLPPIPFSHRASDHATINRRQEDSAPSSPSFQKPIVPQAPSASAVPTAHANVPNANSIPTAKPAPWTRSRTNAQPISNEPSKAHVAASGSSRNEETNSQPTSNPAPFTKSAPSAPSAVPQPTTAPSRTEEPNPQPNSNSAPSVVSPVPAPSDAPKSSASSAVPSPSPSSQPPAVPLGLGRRLLWGLAVPPESKTGTKPWPGFIPWLIKVGAIKPPGITKPSAPPSPEPRRQPPDSS